MENEINYPFVHEFLSRMFCSRDPLLQEMETYAEKEQIPIIQRESARFLETICMITKPLRVLEVGTAIGYSSIILAGMQSEKGIIDTIEMSEDMVTKAIGYIQRAGLEKKIRILQGDAFEILQCLNTPYDLLFLDAAKGQYPDFLPQCLRLLKTGGVLLSDNVLYKGMVARPGYISHKHRTITVRLRDYLEKLNNSDKLVTSIIPVGDGMAVSYKKE